MPRKLNESRREVKPSRRGFPVAPMSCRTTARCGSKQRRHPRLRPRAPAAAIACPAHSRENTGGLAATVLFRRGGRKRNPG